MKIANSYTKTAISYQEFADAFTLDVPTAGSQQSETKVIAKVREWMFARNFATTNAWQRMLRASDRLF